MISRKTSYQNKLLSILLMLVESNDNKYKSYKP